MIFRVVFGSGVPKKRDVACYELLLWGVALKISSSQYERCEGPGPKSFRKELRGSVISVVLDGIELGVTHREVRFREPAEL